MKTIAILMLPFLFQTAFASPRASFQGKAYDESQRLDLSHSTQEEIKAYYADVDTRLSGNAFLDSLYDVISVDNTFVSYDDVTDWYKITDRDWTLSRSIDPDTYRFSDDEDGNYFLVQLYSSGNGDRRKAYNTDANGNSWKKDETLDAIDWEGKKKNNGNIQIDKEHVWAKSHGFAPGNEDPSKGAGTDLHHLIAADHYTNSSGHNNLDFGVVSDKEKSKVIYSYNADGTKDISGYRGDNAEGIEVFEPLDEWKGDVARALLYMATRYSRKGDNTKEEPYLVLTDDWEKEDENDIFLGVQHGLSTFLEWNEKDPVDDYERYRNDLIYKNVQNNRNPYVDHPEWARKAFGEETGPSLDGLLSNYDLYLDHPVTIACNLPQDMEELGYTLDVQIGDESILAIEDDTTLVPKSEGETEVVYVLTSPEEVDRRSTTVRVKALPTLKSESYSDLSSVEIGLFSTIDLKLNLEGGYGETLQILSSNENIIKVNDDGTIRAVFIGDCTLDIAISNNGETIVLKTISLSVIVSPVLLAILIAAVLVLLIILFLLFRHAKKKKKKGKKK